MAYDKPFSPKQAEFLINSTRKYNIAHGSVRSGKTVCVMFRFMEAVIACPGNQIWIIGHTHETVYHNCVRLLWDSPQLEKFAPYCSWSPKNGLMFCDKKINCLGARDERSIGPIQGKTFDLCYCNEMTLYPENVIQMISTRLSMPHSMLFADMNPVQPSHKCKEWIDLAEGGDKNYYSMHFSIDDNPYLSDEFKAMQRQTLTGLFYRRNYLGEWCLAEGAIFDFFDKKIHLQYRPNYPPQTYIIGIDYGASNAFAAVLVGIYLPRYENDGAHMWVEKEYYYDPKQQRQKTNAEFARDLLHFIDGYPIRSTYIDPSAASFKAELQSNGIHCIDAINDVYDGILTMTNLMQEGTLTIHPRCTNLIREIEGYSWDPKASAKGWDEPIKINDHAVDALRYAVKSFLGKRTRLSQFSGKREGDHGYGKTLGKNRTLEQEYPGKEQNTGQWMFR